LGTDGHISKSTNSIELYTGEKDFINLNKIKRNRILKQTNKYYINYTFKVSDIRLHEFLKDYMKHHFFAFYNTPTLEQDWEKWSDNLISFIVILF